MPPIPPCSPSPARRRRRSRSLNPDLVPRPFLKWAGGKTQLASQLLELAPRTIRTYHEPFVGGGALFFALYRAGRLAGSRVVLSDINAELIDTYRAVRDRLDAVIACLREHRYDRDAYYAVREQDPERLDLAPRAARMIYLNRTGFNGLYRVNSRGGFNVPFGRYTDPIICDEPNLRAVSRALAGVDVLKQPFDRVLERARRGQFVYFDPPYVPLSATARFVGYARGGFRQQDQQRLAEVFAGLARRGVRVMLSNSDTPAVHELYAGFRIVTVQARRSVNSRKDRRGPVGEVVVLSYEPEGR